MAPRAITFDVYSALFDTVTGLTDALRDLFVRRSLGEDPAAVARAWRKKHMEYHPSCPADLEERSTVRFSTSGRARPAARPPAR